jgi:AcrR family transcriptional regulator
MSSRVAQEAFAAIPLAGGALRQLRHVCGLFEGPEDAYRTLLPFISDGLQRGERAVQVVDPAIRSSHMDRLAGAGIDVERAIGAGQLVVATWDDTYLAGGHFDSTTMLGYVQAQLDKGRQDGFQITRLIGYTEWAPPDMATAGDLLAYEEQVDIALRGMPDVVICAYDTGRHGAALLLRVLDAHTLGIVEGELRNAVGAGLPARERILQAASELFATRGIGATGVDTLIQAAGVAKATFYRHFPSKDDLVVAWLLDWRTRWFDRVSRKAEEAARSPDQLIPALFDAVAEWVRAGDFRGCPYLNTAAEVVDSADPARRAVRDYLDEIETYLRQALESQGYRDAAALGAELQALLAGGISLSVAYATWHPVLAARDVAVSLLRDVAPAATGDPSMR